MRTSSRSSLALLLLAGGVGFLLCFPLSANGPAPTTASDEGLSDDLQTSRRLIQRYRGDPDHYARLQRDWHAFQALPAEEQARLRQIDQELHALDPDTQARLWKVLDRYTSWLKRLPDADRERIDTASTAEEKLEIVRELREREWIATLPQPWREHLENPRPGEDRESLIASYRQQVRDRRAEWYRTLRPRDGVPSPRLRPVRLNHFRPEVQEFVRKSLRPTLTAEESNRLSGLEGRWPAYPRALVLLAERYPILLPPTLKSGVTQMKQLPEPFRSRLRGERPNAEEKPLLQLEGRWPNFALAVVEAAHARGIPLPETPLGPATADGYTLAVRTFVEELSKDPAAAKALAEARGHWPEYPQTIMQLARERGLDVPGTILPGPSEFWEQMRNALPEIPDRTLRDFIYAELTPEDLDRLELSHDDPNSRERLKQEYFKRHPEALRRSRQQELQPRPPTRTKAN